MGLTDLEEIKYEHEEERENTIQNILKGISEKYFFLILISILVAIYMITQKILTVQQVIIYIGIAIIAIMFMSYRGFQGERYLGYEEALALSEGFIKNMQKKRKIPFGDIKVTMQGRLRKFNGLPDEYATHVRIRTDNYLVRDYEVIVDPKKNGLGIIGVIDARTGFDALRKPEQMMLPTGEMKRAYQEKVYMERGEF